MYLLDRDGTINQYRGLVWKDEDFELEENACDAIERINQSGKLAIVITNQPSVARGLCQIENIETIHKKMSTLLEKEGAYLDDVYFVHTIRIKDTRRKIQHIKFRANAGNQRLV